MGTIAEKLQYTIDAKDDMTAALVEKGVTPPQELSGYGDAIRSIETGQPDLSDWNETFLTFVDIDGNVVKAFSSADVSLWTATTSATDFPAVPELSGGYYGGEWNWTFADVMNALIHNSPGFVGPQYYYDNTKPQYSMVEFEPDSTMLSVMFIVGGANANPKLLWGDGSPEENGTRFNTTNLYYFTHTYTQAGNYKIQFYSPTNNSQFGLAYAPMIIPQSAFLGTTETTLSSSLFDSIKKYAAMPFVKSFYLSENFRPLDGAFGRAMNMTRYIIAPDKTGTWSPFRGCGLTVGAITNNTVGGCGVKCQVWPKEIFEGSTNQTNLAVSQIGPEAKFLCMHPRQPPYPVITTTIMTTYAMALSMRHLRLPYCGSINTRLLQESMRCSNYEDIWIGQDFGNGIGNYVFRECGNLKKVAVPNYTGTTFQGTGLFMDCGSLEEIIGQSTSKLRLGSNQFNGCHVLWNGKNVSLTVGGIGQNAMYGCTGPKSITVGNTGTTDVTIGQAAFQYCNGMMVFRCTKHCASIAQYAFNGCYSCLIFDFSRCTSVPTLANVNAFAAGNAERQIIVPDSLYSTWIAASNWSSLTDVKFVKASEAPDYSFLLN